jgi:hypothetical protein
MDIQTDNSTPHARRLIDALGGIRPAARKLNRRPTTVAYWYETGRVPQAQQQNALDTAIREGVEWTPADFFDAPQQGEAA